VTTMYFSELVKVGDHRCCSELIEHNGLNGVG
jgi:hypothetical protein